MRRTGMGSTVVLAASMLFALTACGGGAEEGDDQPKTTALGITPASQPPHKKAEARKPVALGDLDPPPNAKMVGAPFDPCTTVTWNDFPAAVRIADPSKKPVLMEIKSDSPFQTGCKFENSGSIALNLKNKTTTSNGGRFFTQVVWGKIDFDGFTGTAATLGGKSAKFAADKSPSNGAPTCSLVLKLAKETGGVFVHNGYFPDTDACEVAKVIATVVAQRTP